MANELYYRYVAAHLFDWNPVLQYSGAFTVARVHSLNINRSTNQSVDPSVNQDSCKDERLQETDGQICLNAECAAFIIS